MVNHLGLEISSQFECSQFDAAPDQVAETTPETGFDGHTEVKRSARTPKTAMCIFCKEQFVPKPDGSNILCSTSCKSGKEAEIINMLNERK